MKKLNTNRNLFLLGTMFCTFALTACHNEDIPTVEDYDAELDAELKALVEPYDINEQQYPGGQYGSLFLATTQSFTKPVEDLSEVDDKQHTLGDRLFESTFVPAGNTMRAGLGPLYNNISCIACHPREGRSPFPKELNTVSGFFLRVSVGNDPVNGPIGAPGFGGQLQQNAVAGSTPECKFGVNYISKVEEYPDGRKVVLRKPIYRVYDTYMPMPAGAMFSPRIGMPVFGLGFLEAIPEATILSYADPDDKDLDGISGRPNYVMHGPTKTTMLGRFGWKANAATVEDQCAQAFVNDMGITSWVYPTEACKGQKNVKLPANDNIDLPKRHLDAVAFYARTLQVPVPRDLKNKDVRRGFALFNKVGCAKCHVPSMKTGNSDLKQLSNQTIYAYTDMLLHDMGEDLADHRGDFLANGYEWKTRPLWGIGLTQTVNNHFMLLHDGRANGVEEAILWHGGEADNVKTRFKALPKADRDRIIKFIEQL